MEQITPQPPERSVLEDLVLVEKDQSITELVKWWEGKRFFYNFIVGCVGIIALLLAVGPVRILFTLPFVIAYGIFANLAYTSGWVLQVLWLIYLGKLNPRTKYFLFVVGTAFSVILTISIGVFLLLMK